MVSSLTATPDHTLLYCKAYLLLGSIIIIHSSSILPIIHIISSTLGQSPNSWCATTVSNPHHTIEQRKEIIEYIRFRRRRRR